MARRCGTFRSADESTELVPRRPELAGCSRRYPCDRTDASTTIVEDAMPRTITVIVAAAGIAAATLATPKPAEARCIGCWVGAGIAAGIIGGAIASQSYAYSPYYGGYGYGGG